MDLNSQLSKYQLRTNYDKDQEYIERIEGLKKALNEGKNKTKELKDSLEFSMGKSV